MSNFIKCFILAITVVAGMTPASSWANKQTPTVIVVKTSGDNGMVPRSPAQIPIQGTNTLHPTTRIFNNMQRFYYKRHL